MRENTTWHRRHKESLTFGERAADVLRNGMGSWGFVGGFIGFMIVWALVNTFGPHRFDPFPFILLNLFLSMLAGLQGAILLIAAKRQDAIAAAMAANDLDTDKKTLQQIGALTALVEQLKAQLESKETHFE